MIIACICLVVLLSIVGSIAAAVAIYRRNHP